MLGNGTPAEARPRRILVTGATGMLGQALMAEGRRRGHDMVGAARAGADEAFEAGDQASVRSLVERVQPEVIVNAAAQTSLPACEADPGAAYVVNARLPGLLAELCRGGGPWLVQVSTDHYFTGDGAALHDEACPLRVLNEYARTKLAGEALALTDPGALVLRTNIVGFRGRGAPTFAEWVLGEAGQGREIRAFTDYFVSSISCRQFAAAFFDVIALRPAGILNLAAAEVHSKLQFITQLCACCGIAGARIVPASVRDLGGPARAESLGLDVRRCESLLGRPLPGLREVCEDLAKEHRGEPHAL